MSKRVDEFGRAYAGSQRQIQTIVNQQPAQLNAAIIAAFPSLAHAENIEWVSPLASSQYAEYRDEEFLGCVGHANLAGLLSTFWPSGGPCWDALARVGWDGPSSRTGVILVEAKRYPGEMYSEGGCRASEPARSQIATSLAETKLWCGAECAADWMGRFYQYANRIAHLYFFRELAGINAFLVNVCFGQDPRTPTSISEWQVALQDARRSLGIGQDIPYAADVFLNAFGEALPPLQFTLPKVVPVSLRASKREWRFLEDARNGTRHFYAFRNRKGSSSLRIFDAYTGVLIGRRGARNRNYQEAFAHQLNASVAVTGPRVVDFQRSRSEELVAMQTQVGLDPLGAQQRGNPSGVDEFVDETLGITDIGIKAPHYQHLTSYRRIVDKPLINGGGLIAGMYRRNSRQLAAFPLSRKTELEMAEMPLHQRSKRKSGENF
jgi:hypothetical protein